MSCTQFLALHKCSVNVYYNCYYQGLILSVSLWMYTRFILKVGIMKWFLQKVLALHDLWKIFAPSYVNLEKPSPSVCTDLPSLLSKWNVGYPKLCHPTALSLLLRWEVILVGRITFQFESKLKSVFPTEYEHDGNIIFSKHQKSSCLCYSSSGLTSQLCASMVLLKAMCKIFVKGIYWDQMKFRVPKIPKCHDFISICVHFSSSIKSYQAYFAMSM